MRNRTHSGDPPALCRSMSPDRRRPGQRPHQTRAAALSAGAPGDRKADGEGFCRGSLRAGSAQTASPQTLSVADAGGRWPGDRLVRLVRAPGDPVGSKAAALPRTERRISRGSGHGAAFRAAPGRHEHWQDLRRLPLPAAGPHRRLPCAAASAGRRGAGDPIGRGDQLQPDHRRRGRRAGGRHPRGGHRRKAGSEGPLRCGGHRRMPDDRRPPAGLRLDPGDPRRTGSGSASVRGASGEGDPCPAHSKLRRQLRDKDP